MYGVMAVVWCFSMCMMLAQLVLLTTALVQVLSRPMPNDAKLLWCMLCAFVPVVGPILWWVIGTKQHPAQPPPPPDAEMD